MKKILLCEDEASIREFVVINLANAGFEVFEAESGERALKIYDEQNGDFDIAVLDVMLPGIDGFTVCKELRKKSDKLGIIMLTAKSQEYDKVNGLLLGADDYVTKPFAPSEFLARVEALYRRVLGTQAKSEAAPEKDKFELVSGDFRLNLRNRSLKKLDKQIELTYVEFLLMEYFLSNPNVALDRNDILAKVWGDNYFNEEKIVDVNIRRLRVKIEEDPSSPKHIITVWGRGYKWQE